jgi:hypothetical protein
MLAVSILAVLSAAGRHIGAKTPNGEASNIIRALKARKRKSV